MLENKKSCIHANMLNIITNSKFSIHIIKSKKMILDEICLEMYSQLPKEIGLINNKKCWNTIKLLYIKRIFPNRSNY